MDSKYLRKMHARHKFFRELAVIQEQVNRSIIEDDFSIKEMKERIDHNQPRPIAKSTLDRFVNYGRSGSRKYYVRGPAAPTLFAILHGAGFAFNIQKVMNTAPKTGKRRRRK